MGKEKIKDREYLFLDNESLPEGYDKLDNKEKKKYYKKTQTAYSQLFKRKLNQIYIHGEAWQGVAWLGWARLGKARLGAAWHGLARQGSFPVLSKQGLMLY